MVLLALTVPDSNAGNVLTLKKPTHNIVSPVTEENPFKNIFENITQQLENTNFNESNPMDIVGNIINSGIVNDIFKSLPIPNDAINDANQTFDMNEMMKTVQDIMGKMQENNQQSTSKK